MTALPRPPRRVSKRHRERPVPQVPAEGFARDELDSEDSTPKEPHFEVDDLDSTDDEQLDSRQAAFASPQPHILGFTDAILASDDDDDDPDFELASSQPLPSPPSLPAAGALPFTLAHFASEDEDDDPDFDVSFPREQAQQPIQARSAFQSNENSPPSPHHDMTYAQFLQALNATASGEQHSVPDALSQLLDDDDEFDYMREAAKVRDDPLEFREDLPVSRREVAQLLSERDIALRSQKRQRTKRIASATKASSITPLLPTNLMPAPQAIVPVPSTTSTAPVLAIAAPAPSVPVAAVASVAAAGAPVAPLIAQNAATATQMQQQASLPGTVASPSSTFLSQFQDQLKSFVQILAHVHANSAKSVRQNDDEHVDLATKNAYHQSENMLKRVLENRNISISYHAMLETHLFHVSRFSEGLAFREFEKCFARQNRRSSAYAIEGLADIETFLDDCQTLSLDQMPNKALERVDGISQRHLKQALVTRKRQFTLSGAREGWYTWTAEDDRLLALTIAKYGREVSEYSKDLLPHRLEEDCQARVRHLCSRRCTDNAVKRQMMLISAPLNQQEVHLVQHGLSLFGGRVEDQEVWKRIQRELLPGRQWSLLQKLWMWREARKKTKARYRAKANQKKRALKNVAKRSSDTLAGA